MAEQVLLVDLLLLRGQVLGRIIDYERAAGLAEVLVRDTPDDRAAWLARARTRAIFHRFTEALGDLDAAGDAARTVPRWTPSGRRSFRRSGAPPKPSRCAEKQPERRRDFATLGALAVLQAERGEVTEAEDLFTEARRRYRGVSPFPVAELDFRRGLMWLGEQDLPAARAWFAAAVRRVPAYAPRWATSPRSTPPWAPPTPPSRSCTLSQCAVTTPSTRTASPACSAMPAGPRKPSDGASARRAATRNSSHAIRRHSPTT